MTHALCIVRMILVCNKMDNESFFGIVSVIRQSPMVENRKTVGKSLKLTLSRNNFLKNLLENMLFSGVILCLLHTDIRAFFNYVCMCVVPQINHKMYVCLYFFRLSNCTRFLSFVALHLRTIGESQSYLILRHTNLYNIIKDVLQRHLEVLLLLLRASLRLYYP